MSSERSERVREAVAELKRVIATYSDLGSIIYPVLETVNKVELLWDVDSLSITVSETGPGTGYKEKKHKVYTDVGHIKCSNSEHCEGGVCFDHALRHMIKHRKTHLDWDHAPCQGFSMGTPCPTWFKISFDIKYKVT